MIIHDFDPAKGQAFQGDVSIIPIPADITIAMVDQVKPVAGRLILQEGEVSGHHHAVDVQKNFQAQPRETGDPLMATKPTKLRRALGGMAQAVGTARMYRDAGVPREMVRRGILTRADLAIACLIVEGGPMSVTHEEHDGIRLAPGRYLIGRQVESAGAEDRIVAD